MKKIEGFFTRTRHVWTLAALLAALLVVCGWVWLNNVRPAAEGIRVERINEDYSVKTKPLAAGQEVIQPFIATVEEVHGGSFIFTVYDHVCFGTLMLELRDAQGKVLASVSKETTQLLDNTYQDLVFADGVAVQKGAEYRYVLRFEPADAASELGLWCSEGAVKGLLPMTIGGEDDGRTLGFSIVTNRVGDWLKKTYLGFVLFALALTAAGYWLLFIRRAGIVPCFVFFAMTLGVLFLFVLPPYVAPDEEIHIHSAYHYSNVMLGISDADGLTMRADDAVVLDHTDKVSAFSYQTVAKAFFRPCADQKLVTTKYPTTGTFFLQYIPAAMGLTLARLLGFNYITCILLGRFTSLLVYTALMALAIHTMPAYKRILACVGLLPMSLHLAASFNYDASLLGMAALFVALVLSYATERTVLRWRDLLVLAVVAALMAPMKMLYVLLVPLCLMIPARKCPGKARWMVAGLFVLAAVFAVRFAPYILHYIGLTPESLAEAANKVVAQVNPDNVDYHETEFWGLSYVLTHLSGTFKLLAATVQQNTTLYLTQIVGGELGEPILGGLLAWVPAVCGLWGVLLLSAVPAEEEKPLLSRGAKAWSALLLLAICGALLIVVLGWTPLRNTTLWGLQGRYLLPILPLLLLVFQNEGLRLRRQPWRRLLCAQCVLCLLTAGSVFQSILAQ